MGTGLFLGYRLQLSPPSSLWKSLLLEAPAGSILCRGVGSELILQGVSQANMTNMVRYASIASPSAPCSLSLELSLFSNLVRRLS